MIKRDALNGKPYAGNSYVRFDEGGVASSATPRCRSLLYSFFEKATGSGLFRFSLRQGIAVTVGLMVVSVFGIGDDFNIIGSSGSSMREAGSRQVLTFLQNGSFTVHGSGTVELLMVGGGGGGGEDVIRESSNVGGAGGGAGGVVHREVFSVSPGTYTVEIGAGGEVRTASNNAEAMGGNTVLSKDGVLLLTAFGGGFGAYNGQNGGDGGCGGGGAYSYWSSTGTRAGGSAIYGDSGNLGFGGGTSTHKYVPAGGGGAGGPGLDNGGKSASGTTLPGSGGIGYACSITGTEIYYAGGGGGWCRGVVGVGGVGGGGDGHKAGADGLGGGGGANAKGGSGVLIISFVQSGVTDDFEISGTGESRRVGDDMVMSFVTAGSFTVTGAGAVELLMVGGGGGGGEDVIRESSNVGGAGGGAGGVVHREVFSVSPGTYTVEIGAGGEVRTASNNAEAMGGNTVLSKDGVLLLTAFGGGFGAYNGQNGGDGGCGGGGAYSYWSSTGTRAGGSAIYGDSGNLGFGGGTSTHKYVPAGGGGAGGPGLDNGGKSASGTTLPGSGGIGYACSITGTEIYYAGGGGGWCRGVVGVGGVGGGGDGHKAGADGLGGGGGANAKGGSGVLIIRYRRRAIGMRIVVQ